MSLIAPPMTAPVREPLTAMQRFRARDQLQDLWRAHVGELTELAVRFHSCEAEEGAYAARLSHDIAAVRSRLVEIEDAMHRLDVGSYGECETCRLTIAAHEMTAWPDRRYCADCLQSLDATGT